MKKLLLAISLLLACPVLFGAGKVSHPLLATKKVVWAGLDYSMVRMIGPGDFRKPSVIFPDMLNRWNDLFAIKQIKFVEKITRKEVIIDIEGTSARNLTATADQIIHFPKEPDTIDQTHIQTQDISNAVKSYKLYSTNGLGVVFIVDRLIKKDKKGEGALYVVLFDVATREVIASERKIYKAKGIGFRNYWFRVIKEAEADLKMCREP